MLKYIVPSDDVSSQLMKVQNELSVLYKAKQTSYFFKLVTELSQIMRNFFWITILTGKGSYDVSLYNTNNVQFQFYAFVYFDAINYSVCTLS